MYTKYLPLVIFLGVIFRFAFPLVIWLTGHDPKSFLADDSATYMVPAGNLALHGYFGTDGQPEIMRTPGYPWLLAPGMALGAVIGWAVGIQCALSIATIAGIYLLTLEVTSDRRTALIAAAIYALEPLSIIFVAKVLTETLFTFLLTFAMWSFCRYLNRADRPWPWLLFAGMLVAALAFTRPIGLYLPLVIFAYLAGVALQRRNAKLVLHGAIFLLVALGPCAGWVARNAALTGYQGFSSVTDEDLYFYKGAAVVAATTGKSYYDVQKAWGISSDETFLERHPGLQGAPRPERYRVMRQEGRSILLAHPVAYAKIHLAGIARTLALAGAEEVLRPLNLYPKAGGLLGRLIDQGPLRTAVYVAEKQPVLFWSNLVLTLGLLATYVLAGLGLFSGVVRRRWIPAGFIVCVAAYFVVLSGGPEGTARFRHPIMPSLVVLAACGFRLNRRLLPLGQEPAQVPPMAT